MLFQLLEPLKVKLLAVNLPARKKGPEVIHLTDVVLEFEGANTLLDLFDPELRSMLYRPLREGEKAQQPSLDGIDVISDMPVLRSTTLRLPIALASEFTGYTMTLDRGRGTKDSNIAADEVTVKRIRVWPKEGGSVKGEMHLQSRNVSGSEVGQLRDMLKLETAVTLRAPAIQEEIERETQTRGATSPVPKASRNTAAQTPAAKAAPKGGKPAAAAAKSATTKAQDKANKATQAFIAAHGGAAPTSVQ